MAVVLPDPLFANQQKRKRNTPADTTQDSPYALLATSAPTAPQFSANPGPSAPYKKRIYSETSQDSFPALLATSSVAAAPFKAIPFPQTPRAKRIYSETSQSSSEVLDFAYDNIASVSLEMQPAPYRRRTLYNTSTGTPLVLYASSPTITGTLATTNANDTSAAAGTTTILGTLAKTNANDTSSAAGTTTVLGALAKTNANDTSAAAGTTTVLGTLATTNANDTLAASGSVGGAVSGTLATTNANDTSAGAGTTTVLGSLARTNANDTTSAAGTTTVLGTLATTNANDTLAASGAAGTVTGTLAVTNNNDTLESNPPRVLTIGAPGGGRYVVFINGAQYIGSRAYIDLIIEEFARKQARKAISDDKPAKPPRIVVQPGKKSAKLPDMAPVSVQIQQDIRNYYVETYAKALQNLQDDEDDTLMMLL